MAAPKKVEFSVVVPVYNEEENIVGLLEEIRAAGSKLPMAEVIFVNDGSSDQTRHVLLSQQRGFQKLRVIDLKDRSGQSAALWHGIRAAHSPIIITMDGDGQNNPDDMKHLYSHFRALMELDPHRHVMIAGARVKRRDGAVKKISSRLANSIRSAILQDNVGDTGCGLKLFWRKDFMALPYFNHMHRFLPALMLREGVAVEKLPVDHRPREAGVSKYGTLDRLLVGIVDLFGVRWLQKRGRRITTVTPYDIQ